MKTLKKILSSVILLLCTTLLFGQSFPKGENTIRLLTYNTHYCKGGTDPGIINEENTRKFAQVIQALDPDVVSLQELDSACNGRGKRYQLGQIATFSQLPFDAIYGAAASYDGGKIGCGILIRKDLPVKKIKKITLPGAEARIGLRVDTEDLSFMATHLDLDDTKRIMSANKICSEADYVSRPLFVAGDLNDSFRWNNLAFSVFLNTFDIASSIEGSSLPGRTDGTQSLIDYILLKKDEASNVTIVDTKIVRGVEINGKVVDLATISDHYPVFVDIQLNSSSNVQNNNSSPFHFYPNPVMNEITITNNSPVNQVSIYAANGQKVICIVQEDIRTLNIAQLPKGVYILKGYSGDQCYTAKLIKE